MGTNSITLWQSLDGEFNMKITSETKTGEHKGIKFLVSDGLLYINGMSFSVNKVKQIMEIITLLKVEGIQPISWEKFDLDDDDEDILDNDDTMC